MMPQMPRGYARGYEEGAQTLTDYLACYSSEYNNKAAAEIINNENLPEDFPTCPAPLSGEWAGQSIPELFGLAIGAEWPTDEELNNYEDHYYDGWWAGIREVATDWLDTQVNAGELDFCARCTNADLVCIC
jgi:hypothetical protein